MQFYDVIKERTSISKFKGNPIKDDALSRMVEATLMSPSWKNNSSYRIILIDDFNQKDALANCIMNDTDKASLSVRQAPLIAVVVGNPDLSGKVQDKDFYLVDAAIAMEHFVLAATSEGYGTCWIAALNEDEVKNILDIPQNYRVIALTPVGEIAEEKQHYIPKDIENMVYLNNWNNSYISRLPKKKV